MSAATITERADKESTALVKHESLSLLASARAQLAKASTVQEVKTIRDKAAALQVYLKQQSESLEAQHACSEIKLRAERRAGELLAEMKTKGERKGDGKPNKKPSQRVTVSEPTLSDLGIDRMQATRWQREASVPDDTFEEYVEQTKAKGEELTQAGLLKLAPKAQAERVTEPPNSADELSAECAHIRRLIEKRAERWRKDWYPMISEELIFLSDRVKRGQI